MGGTVVYGFESIGLVLGMVPQPRVCGPMVAGTLFVAIARRGG